MPNYGEEKGARKRARALATHKRREVQAERTEQLSHAPLTQAEAAARWDAFYRTKPNLFKDRHILRESFPQLMGKEAAANPKAQIPPLRAEVRQSQSTQSQSTHACHTDQQLACRSMRDIAHDVRDSRSSSCDLLLLEVGCGGGNAVYPVLRANQRLFALAFDFSQEAVSVTIASSEYRSDRIFAFQADLTQPRTYLDVLNGVTMDGANFVTVFWTLSALPPAVHRTVVEGLVSASAQGGMLFFRDYAVGDMREEKFKDSGRAVENETSSRLFMRGDGTYAYFFEVDEIRALFQAAGATCESCVYEERTVENRKQDLTMCRRWVKASFKKIARHNNLDSG